LATVGLAAAETIENIKDVYSRRETRNSKDASNSRDANNRNSIIRDPNSNKMVANNS
jgi:hypothetical protein